MPDTRYWQDEQARQELIAHGRARFADIRDSLDAEQGVVAIEPESGTYFIGSTLGKANDRASEQYPDRWLYFVRVDNPGAEMVLPTW